MIRRTGETTAGHGLQVTEIASPASISTDAKPAAVPAEKQQVAPSKAAARDISARKAQIDLEEKIRQAGLLDQSPAAGTQRRAATQLHTAVASNLGAKELKHANAINQLLPSQPTLGEILTGGRPIRHWSGTFMIDGVPHHALIEFASNGHWKFFVDGAPLLSGNAQLIQSGQNGVVFNMLPFDTAINLHPPYTDFVVDNNLTPFPDLNGKPIVFRPLP